MNPLVQKRSFGMSQLLLLLSISVLGIAVVLPVALIFFNAFWVNGQFNMRDVIRVVSEPDTWEALVNTITIALGTTVGSTIIGTFFAWLVTRTDLPYKRFMKALFLVPFMFPSFIGAMAWRILLAPRAGLINRFFMTTFGFSGPVFNIHSYAGIVLVGVMYLFPFVFIQVCGALERMDPTLEESARISGAGLSTITRKITLPLVLPSIMSGALLVMLYSMAHFGIVAVLGTQRGIFNIPTLIYQRIHQTGGNFASIRTGTVLSAILVLTAAFILWLQRKILERGNYQIIAGKSFRPMELRLGSARVPLFLFCLAYLAFTIVLPTVIIFLVGGLRTYGLPFTWENLSLDNYKFILFKYRVTRDAIWNSVTLGFSAAVITMFTGLMISYVIVKMKVRGKGILELLGTLPFSVPGSVIALGVILTWGGRYGINLYNTAWIILIAYVARYMAFSLRANSAALAQVHDSLMEAARVCGASMGQTLKDIVLPLVRPGMLSAFFLIFLPSLRELTISVMLYAPNTRTIGVAIYTLNDAGQTVIATALAGIALIIIVAGQLLVERFFSKKAHG